jgi:hypothetical protein
MNRTCSPKDSKRFMDGWGESLNRFESLGIAPAAFVSAKNFPT